MSADPESVEDAIELFRESRRRGEPADSAVFCARYLHFAPDLALALDALLAHEEPIRAPLPIDSTVPERVGPFRVVREIGRGGMGVVLEAVEEALGRRVALKVLPPELLRSNSARERFRREAELAARLDHPGIATVFGAGVEDDRPWIAMRYVEGETLNKAIARAREQHVSSVRLSHSAASGRAAALALAACLAKVARALQSAHDHGVVHRDVKPSNIIVAEGGAPVLVDFGLAIAAESEGHALTRTGETAGTPAYLSPECINAEIARPDAQSDVYALGVTLYECLALRRPFDEPTPVALYRAIVAGVPRALASVNKSVPRDLAVIVATAMERDRGRRYGSAAVLADDLEACVAGHPIAARPIPLAGRVLRWARREPRQALLASLLTITAVSLAIFGGNWWASRDEVHAAERFARIAEREDALVEGFTQLEDSGAADAAFARALALDPTCLEALAGRALVHVGGFKKDKALEILARAPDTPGFEALRSFCRGQAVTQDKQPISSPDVTALDLFLIGISLSGEAQRLPLSRQKAVQVRALAMLTEAVVRSPTPRSFLHVLRAFAAGAAGDQRAARSSAGALLALWPDSSHAVFAAGYVMESIDTELARSSLERATRMRPSDPAPFHELGLLYGDLGNPEESERWLWLALARRPEAESYNALGVSLALRGCNDEACLAWQSALALQSRNEWAWLNLGQWALETGRPEVARFDFERVLDLDLLEPQSHGYLGAALHALGDLESARVHLETSLALDPERPDFLSELASTQIALGDRDAASVSVDAGLAIAPDDAQLRDLRARLEASK